VTSFVLPDLSSSKRGGPINVPGTANVYPEITPCCAGLHGTGGGAAPQVAINQ